MRDTPRDAAGGNNRPAVIRAYGNGKSINTVPTAAEES